MKSIRFSICLFVIFLGLNCYFTSPAIDYELAAETIRVMAESDPVHRVSMGTLIPVSQFGTNLESGDEVITGPGGKAHILLSLLSDNDEIVLAPSSRIQLTRDDTGSGPTLLKIRLLYGKIRAKTMLSADKQIRIDTDSAEVVADEGEFIVESNNRGTQVGTVSGIVKMVSTATEEAIYVPQKTMTSAGSGQGPTPVEGIAKNLFEGVEKSESEKTIDAEALREAHTKEAEKRKAKQLLAEQQDRERQLAEAAEQPMKPEPVEPVQDQSVDEMLMAADSELETVETEPAIEPVEETIEDEPFHVTYKWHIAATSTMLVFNWLALEEANSYNDLANKNDRLKTRYENATSASERESHLASFQVNKEKMSQHESNMQLYNYIALGAAIWEGYLLYNLFFTGSEASLAEEASFINKGLHIQPLFSEQDSSISLSYRYQW